MPIFEYHCPDCNATFEKLLTETKPSFPCPQCGKTALRKVSTFAAGQTGTSGGGCAAPGGSGFS